MVRKHKILDEFFADLYCGWCKAVTEHHVQEVDECVNGEFIGYYALCSVCGDVNEVSKEELESDR